LLLFTGCAFKTVLAYALHLDFVTLASIHALGQTVFFFALRTREPHFAFADTSASVAFTPLEADVALATSQLDSAFHRRRNTPLLLTSSTTPGAVAETFTNLAVADTIGTTTAIFARASSFFACDSRPWIIAYTFTSLEITAALFSAVGCGALSVEARAA